MNNMDLPPQKPKSKWLLAAKIMRYIIGLGLILFVLVFLPFYTHNSPFIIFMFMITPPPALLIDPIVLAGLYFMLSGKFRLRLDVTILLVVIGCVCGLSALIQSSNTNTSAENIQGDAMFKITVVNEQNAPMANLEVDIGMRADAGPPPGGIMTTDKDGLAIFSVQPAKYFVFFNSSNFPGQYDYPPAAGPFDVIKDKINEQQIILKKK